MYTFFQSFVQSRKNDVYAEAFFRPQAEDILVATEPPIHAQNRCCTAIHVNPHTRHTYTT